MVEELGNAVAFASAPLHVGPPVSGHSDSDPSVHGQKASDNVLQRTSKAERKRDIASNQVLESFYVVPSINRPGKPARGNSAPILEEGLSRPNSASNKTHEELVAENTTLKETLDQLSKRLDWITKERLKEKETLKDSVTIFARDVRKQAERLGQSTISFTDNRRQIIPPLPQPMTALPVFMHGINNNSHQTEELQKKVLYLQEEVKLAKLESEKQAANAQRYKARYDDLRKAILEKRKAKEMALAAATAAAGTGVVADNTSTPDRARTGETAVRHSSDHQSRTAATTEGRQDGKASPTT